MNDSDPLGIDLADLSGDSEGEQRIDFSADQADIIAKTKSMPVTLKDKVTITFLLPKEEGKEIKIEVDDTFSISELKKEFTKSHHQKPQPDAQTIIYKGRKLTDDQIVGDLL